MSVFYKNNDVLVKIIGENNGAWTHKMWLSKETLYHHHNDVHDEYKLLKLTSHSFFMKMKMGR